MSKFKLPKKIEDLPNGPHKRDEIRHFVKALRKERKECQC
jgi:hypothetical protein